MEKQPKNYFIITIMFSLLLSVFSSAALADSLYFYTDKQQTKGIVYKPGQICYLAWKVLNDKGSELTEAELEKNYLHFSLTIHQKTKTEEKILQIKKLESPTLEYNWEIPPVTQKNVFRVTLDAVAQSNSSARLSSELLLYVSPAKNLSLKLSDLSSCLTVLMDWNGRRGYYNQCSPAEALKYAQKACDFLRQKVDPAEYQDYLDVIEKTEQVQLASLDLYCSVKGARLQVGRWFAGFFKEWDTKQKMYHLRIELPIDQSRAYPILVKRLSKVYKTAHTHTGQSACVIENLNETGIITVKTAFSRSIVLTGYNSKNEWEKEHRVRLYLDKSQVLRVRIEEGDISLRIYLNPKGSQILEIGKSGTSFYLNKEGRRYNFSGNEVNLLDF